MNTTSNTMKYYRMDQMVIALSLVSMFMYLPGQAPKVADVLSNQQHVDIIKKCPEISQEEFEEALPKDYSTDTILFRLRYDATKKVMETVA